MVAVVMEVVVTVAVAAGEHRKTPKLLSVMPLSSI
jgi:hypothetical protein